MKTTNNAALGVCVIGSGRAGMIHAHNFAKYVPDARLVAMVDAVEETAKSACEMLGVETYYQSHTQALDNKDIDAFIIVSPTKFHRDIAIDIAAAGRHILCEKPMAMTVAECDDMIAAANKNGIVLQIGFMRRFDASFIKAKKIVESGIIGEVVMVRSNTRGPSVPRPWMYDIRKSNGPLAEVNSHDIDTLRWFTESEFDTIYAIGGNFRSSAAKEEYPDFYDNVVIAAGFKNGMQGMIDGAQGVKYAYDARVEVLGTKGCIFIGKLKDETVLTCTAKNGNYPLVDTWRKLFKEAYLNEDIAFIESIRNGTQPKVTGLDGKKVVQVVNAGNVSIIEKCVVNL